MSSTKPTSESLRTKLLQITSEELNRQESAEVQDVTLKLADLSIGSIPTELIELIKENVGKLSLQNNQLWQLPNYFNKLSELKYLNLSSNRFVDFPAVLTMFTQLEVLDLSQNSIRKLPLNLGNMASLTTLILKENKIEYLPSSVSDLHNLKTLDISENPLIVPSINYVIELQHASDNDNWIDKLKLYLTENAKYLDNKLQEKDLLPNERSRSNSSDFVSSKAAKRMGFIVNKKNASSYVLPHDDETNTTPTNNVRAAPAASQLQQETTLRRHQHSLSQPDFMKFSTNSSPSQPSINGSTPQHNHTATVPASISTANNNTSIASALMPAMEEIKEESDHKSSAYFKRLSTLQEVKKPKDATIFSVSRKLLYIFTVLHSNINKITLFCANKKVTAKMNGFLLSAKQLIDAYIEILEDLELEDSKAYEAADRLLHCIATSLGIFKQIMRCLQENLGEFFENIDICFIRSLYLNMYGSFMELFNASKILYPNLTAGSSGNPMLFGNGTANSEQQRPRMPSGASTSTTISTATELPAAGRHPPLTHGAPPVLRVDTGMAQAAAQAAQSAAPGSSIPPVVHSAQQPPTQVSDERLLESVYNATSAAQIVFSQLTNAINKTAWNNVATQLPNPQGAGSTPNGTTVATNGGPATGNNGAANNEIVTSKVKDLTNICVSAIECTKSLKNSLHVVSTSIPQQQDKLKFYKDTNAFLTSVINILHTTKASINDLPVLNELRPSLAALTKATKDVTIMLENSSFKTIYLSQQQQQHDDQHGSQVSQQQQHQHQQQQVPQSAVHPPPLSSIPSMAAFPPFNQQQSLMTQQQQLNNIVASLPPVTTPLVAALGNAQAQAVLQTSGITSPLHHHQQAQAQAQQHAQQAMNGNPFETSFAANGSANGSMARDDGNMSK